VKLLASTKSDQTEQADTIFTYETVSGIQFGAQVEELFDIIDQPGWHDGPLFWHSTVLAWTSAYCRKTHLIPLLEMQAAAGDRILRQKVRIGETPITMAQRFYSVRSYCQDLSTMVAKHRPGENLRESVYAEVVEHAWWWRRSQGSEAMAVHYQEVTLCDRLYITLLCM
jgi:hypothetical protein